VKYHEVKFLERMPEVGGYLHDKTLLLTSRLYISKISMLIKIVIFINGKEVKCAEISQRLCIHLNLSSQNHTYNIFQMKMDGPPVYSHSRNSKQQSE
jgi:hypothetical protein